MLRQIKCLILHTLVPEVFLDFSLLELRQPRSGDRYYDITSREAARTRNIVISIAASRLSHLKRRKIKKNLWDQGKYYNVMLEGGHHGMRLGPPCKPHVGNVS